MRNAIVVNADDLGVSRGATLGIVQAHLQGVVSSASLAPSGADYRYAVETVLRGCPNLGIGLHFTLSAGKPVSSPLDVPLLVDERGYFKWEFVSLFRRLGWSMKGDLLDQIEIELEAQIGQLHKDGIQPDHIDSERHVHLIPGIFDRVNLAAKRHGIPFVRAGNDFSLRLIRLAHFRPAVLRGGLVKFVLLQGLTWINRRKNKNINSCDNFASYVFTGHLDLVLRDILEKSPDGVTEIMVHPGVPEDSENVHLANAGLEQYLKLEDRRRELTACQQACKLTEGLNICSFSDLDGRKNQRSEWLNR